MPDNRGIDVTALRRILSRRVESSSLRAVARAVGMSPTGLQKFLGGAQPYTPTRRRLERWYVRESASYAAETTAESARAALAVLTHDVSPKEQRALSKRIVIAIEEYYVSLGENPPAWLRVLKRS